MDVRSSLIQRILSVQEHQFEALALELAQFQYRNNALYRKYCDLLDKSPQKASGLENIAFLPIQFFRQTLISSNADTPRIVFESSTTTGGVPSRHGLWDEALYHQVSRRGFEEIVGESLESVTWLALLPSYLERPNASLVAMMRHFIKHGGDGSGFYLDDFDALANQLQHSRKTGQPTILLGVSFALLDFAERYPMPLGDIRVMETGGMKGRREEITRADLHEQLKEAFTVSAIGSEYGMTELLSQAWSRGDGLFHCSPSLRVLMRDMYEPTRILPSGIRGGVNCIDLANVDSCAFIATDDVGVNNPGGTFEILGRMDGSEQRGCNLMVSDVI